MRLSTCALLLTLGLAAGMTADGCNFNGLPERVRPSPPFSAEASVDQPGVVTLTLDLSFYPEALLVNYDFGDGSQANGLLPAVAKIYDHSYLRGGDITINAYVFNGQREQIATASTTITVTLPASSQPGTQPSTQPGTQPSTQPTTRVRLHTNLGDIVLHLETGAAPNTVANFLRYVDEGHYNNIVFHRVVPNFVIQGGAFRSLGAGADPRLTETTAHAPISSEAHNGLSNVRGTVSMALRGQDANSATDQFFINLKDNTSLDNGPPPFTVFATVAEGLDVVDQIGQVATGTFNVQTNSGVFPFEDVPVDDVTIVSATRE